jgi:hypothetical protein
MEGHRMQPAWEDAMFRRLAGAAGLPFVDLRRYSISPGILRRVPASQARARRWVPMVFNPRRVVLVVDDPALPFTQDPEELAALLDATPDLGFEFALASPSALDAVIEFRCRSVAR